MRSLLLIFSLVGLLVLALAFGAYEWWRLAEVPIGIHGLIAMTLGAVLSLILGGGLMALVFYSHRRGHDDEAHAPHAPGRGDSDS